MPKDRQPTIRKVYGSNMKTKLTEKERLQKYMTLNELDLIQDKIKVIRKKVNARKWGEARRELLFGLDAIYNSVKNDINNMTFPEDK